MNRVAFSLFGIDVRWYGVIISIGTILGVIVALRESKRLGVKEDNLLDFLLYQIPLCILGARLYYVVFSWDIYKDNPIKALDIRSGGLAIHGAIITAIMVAIVFCKKRNISFWKIADVSAPGLILAQSIGRWGNYVNQEAHGGPTDLPWGIMVNGQKVHPTFLYESIWNFIVFLFLMWYSRKKRKEEGEVFLLYLSLYSFIRYFIESLRTDSLMWGSIKVAQLVSVIGVVVPLIIFIKRRKQGKN